MAAARPTSAAAGLLACAAVLLLLAGQSAAIVYVFPFATTFPGVFPVGYVAPPPVRIYSKQNTGMNIAVRDGKVVAVPATYGDARQLWWKIPRAQTSLAGYGVGEYWLLNVYTGQAMTSPPVNGPMQVQLEQFNPTSLAQLWASTPPLNGVFYQIKPYTQYSKALNGLWGNVRDGTEIGIYSDKPVSLNTLWFTTSAFPFY